MRLTSTLKSGVPILAASIAALSLFAQAPTTPAKETPTTESKGLPPRATPADYQAQTQAGSVTIAAEFTGHAVPTADGVFNTEDFVIVEAAVFGAQDTKLLLAGDQFSLRINGKKTLSPSVPTELVLKSLKDPNWEPPTPPEAKSKTSFGSGGVEKSTPVPVHMPVELQHAMSQKVQRAALLEGERTLPQAGLLFFQYRGKQEGIRSLELVYNGPAGPATLKLQP